MFKVTSGSSQVYHSAYTKHLLSFIAQPESFTSSINVDNEQYFQRDFATTANSENSKIILRINFSNLKTSNASLSDFKLPEDTIGTASCSTTDHSGVIKMFYEIYLEDEPFKAIERLSLSKLPSSISVSLQNADGSYFVDDWHKDSNGRYPKAYISDFYYSCDLTN
jgi:hypothetical protein